MNTIENRQQRQKELLLEQLQKVPIIQIACEKSGISRATYYRWRKEDEKFGKQADHSIHLGVQLVSDLAESQLLSAIRNQNLTAIIFWLKHRHKAYKQRVEVSAPETRELTAEERKLLHNSLQMGDLLIHNTSKK